MANDNYPHLNTSSEKLIMFILICRMLDPVVVCEVLQVMECNGECQGRNIVTANEMINYLYQIILTFRRFLVWNSWDGSYLGSSQGKQGIGSSQK